MGQSRQQLPEESLALCVGTVLQTWKRYFEREQMSRIEAWIHIHEPDETANQQSGTCKQDQRQAHLHDHERAAGHTAALSGRRSTASFFERLGHTRMRRDKRWKEPKDQPSKQRGSNREGQNAHVNRDSAQIKKISRARRKQSVRAPKSQGHSNAAANNS